MKELFLQLYNNSMCGESFITHPVCITVLRVMRDWSHGCSEATSCFLGIPLANLWYCCLLEHFGSETVEFAYMLITTTS